MNAFMSRRTFVCVALAGAVALGMCPASSLAVGITLVYTHAFNTGAPEGAEAVVVQAAANWQAAITDPFDLAITFDWAIPPGGSSQGPCGVGGVATVDGNRPATGGVTLNSALGNWFVDPTPAEHEEFNGVVGKPWMGTPKVGGPAVAKEDMLSCAMHEIGHVLGYFYDSAAGGHFGPYKAEVDQLVGDPPGVPQNGINVDAYIGGAGVIPVGAGAGGGGSDDLRSHWAAGFALPGGVVTTDDLLMAKCQFCPPGECGGRTLASQYDIAGLAQIYALGVGGGYDLAPDFFLPVPEPGTLAFLGLGGLVLIRRRRRL